MIPGAGHAGEAMVFNLKVKAASEVTGHLAAIC
jgi:hypothetical protein